MCRPSQPTWGAAASLALLLAVSVPPLHGGSRPAPQGPSPDLARGLAAERGRDTRETTGPPRGMRTYGRGAVRLAREAATPSPDSGRTQRSSLPAGVGVVRKISGATMVGEVTAFALSPNGATAVYIADQDVAGRFELYSSPVDGSAPPTKISTGLVFDPAEHGVTSFQISPDGTQVVFAADPNAAGNDDVFSVPINGSTTPVRLNTAAQAPVTAFGLAPLGGRVGFFGTDTTFGGGNVELYVATLGVVASARQVSDASASQAAGDAVFADFTPNGSRLIYAADAVADQVFQWFSVPATATAPGSDVQLSAALGSVSLGAVDPASTRLVYAADELLLGVAEVFSIPIGGGAKVRLNPAMAGDGARLLAISPDGARVGYLADQHTAGVPEVYAASIAVAGSGIRLNVPLSGTQRADTLNIGPDSATVLYEADQTTAGTFQLYRVPIDASATSTTLQGLVAPQDAGFFEGLGTPIVGRRAVYPVRTFAVDLFGVPYDGSAAAVRLNDALVAGDTVFDAFLPELATRLTAYGAGAAARTNPQRLYAVPIRRDLAPEQVNSSAGLAAIGVLGYEIASSQNHAVYLQDQDTIDKLELYSRELDSDADTVINAVDNCPFAANLAQARVVFGQTVTASGKTRFDWTTPTDVRFVRGPLHQVNVLATNLTGTLLDTASFTDATAPAAGAGLYYLFAPDCPGRSYQTVLGAEPARDLAAFP